MSANGHRSNGHRAAASVSAAAPVILVRYRPGHAGESARVVHLVPLSTATPPGAVSALCGRLLPPQYIEQVTPGAGMPCMGCLTSHLSSAPQPDTEPADSSAAHTPADSLSPDAGPVAAAQRYRAWGWPVVLRREQVWLDLRTTTVAVQLPMPLATQVGAILIQRRCPPALFVHPAAPGHRVLLASERFPVTLPYPSGVHRVTGTVLLPPAATPAGPLTWVTPPGPNTLTNCREVDVVAALRTALDEPPPTAPTAF